MAELKKRKTTVHYLVSLPRKFYQTRDKLKLNVNCFTRLEVATRRIIVCFLYEPRAAFYTDMTGKMQKINVRIASTVRKNFQSGFQCCAGAFKKSWKSGEEVT